MKILSHRGLWGHGLPQNTLEAFQKSTANDFGFESDIRDYCGNLVISHNPASASSPLLKDVLHLLSAHDDNYCFAINIKADGLADSLASLLEKYQITQYFCFDMSVPQMIEFRDRGLRFFTRQSEFETFPPVLLPDASGVWIDAFERSDWLTIPLIQSYIELNKEVCLVSPELHHRPHIPFWNWLKSNDMIFSKIILCTDYPCEAKSFFEGENSSCKK